MFPKLRAHVIGVGNDSHTTEVQPVRIPAGTDSRVPAQLSIGVPSTLVADQFKAVIRQVKKAPSHGRGVSRSAFTMPVIPAIGLAPEIVEDRKQSHDHSDCSGPFGQ